MIRKNLVHSFKIVLYILSEFEETSEYWNNVGQFTLQHVLQRQMNEKPAKNVILFMGDGMSIGTMTAGKRRVSFWAFFSSFLIITN